MWVFCKNKCVKQKKQILDVQNGKIYAQADVIALVGSSQAVTRQAKVHIIAFLI